MGKGILSGAINATTKFESGDFSNAVPRFSSENRTANQALVDFLRDISEAKNATSAQIAIAWLLAQKPWILLSTGTSTLHRLHKNIGSVNVDLSKTEFRSMVTALKNIEILRGGYSEELLSRMDK